jgi:hypothetical protein
LCKLYGMEWLEYEARENERGWIWLR